MSDKKQTTTIRDLQTFIDAVEFASDQEEWVPSARQWKRIRDMINSLEETKAPPPAPVREPQYAGPPQFAMPQMPAIPAGPSNLPGAMNGMPHMPQMPQHSMNPLLAHHGQVPVRTPDIDTTNGQPYQSSFAL